MASSGYLNTSNQYIKYWIEIITNSQNINNNTSNVTVKVWAKRTNTGYKTYGSGTVTLKVDGVYHNSGSKQIEITSSNKVYHSWTGDIKHNGDGTKKLTCSAAINIPSVLSSSEQSYSLNLKTIPRTSSFSLSKSSCELGTSFTVNISRASSSFTHAVTFTIGGQTIYIQKWDNSNINPSYTPPITDAEYIKKGTSGTATIKVETYNGGKLIGTSTKNLTLTVPASVKPTFANVSAVKIPNGDEAVNCFVQGYSKIRATIHEAKGIYGSTITTHYYTINNTHYNSSSNVQDSGVITNAGNVVVSAEVADSRGRVSGVKSINVQIEPYTKPTIKDVIVRRVNSDYEYNPDGVYIQVKATKIFSSLNGENDCTLYVWWREAGGTWSSEILLPNNENYNFDGQIFSNDKRYEICIRAKDKLTQIDSYYNVPTAEVTMDFKKGGKGIAIGKVAELDNILDINIPILARNTLDVLGDLIMGRTMTIDTSQQNEELIETTKDLISFRTKSNKGITFEGMTFRPFSGFNNKLDLGTNEVRWRALWLGAFNKSLNGYTTLPNGLILQWGYTGSGNALTVTFPIAFSSNNSYVFIATPYYSNDATGLNWRSDAATATKISLFSTKNNNYYWVAMGW